MNDFQKYINGVSREMAAKDEEMLYSAFMIEGNGENTRWHYDEWDEAHDYGIEQAPILSTFKQEGQR